MAIVRVQAASDDATTETSTTASWGSPTGTGNLLIAVLMTRHNAYDITPPTGMTLYEEQTSDVDERIWIYYEPNCAQRSGTQTFTWTTASDATMHLAEYSGMATSTVLDLTATATDSSGDPSSGTTATTNQDEELWFAAICNRNIGVQGSPTNGFAQVNRIHSANANAGYQLEGAIYEKIVATVGTAGTSVTLTPSDNRPWAGLILTFRGAGGSAAAVTPTTVAAVATIPGVTVTADIDGVVETTTVVGASSIPTPTLTASASVTPTTVAATANVPTPTVNEAVPQVTPTGWTRDPRQSRFLGYRPPFVNADPGVDV
jgi:hypothetical protein